MPSLSPPSLRGAPTAQPDVAQPPITQSPITLAASLGTAFQPLDPVERLLLLRHAVPGPLVFTTSFGLEDQALTHLILRSEIEARFVTLDTGRLFPETHALWAATERHYGIRIEGYYPDTAALEALVDAQGIDGFYTGREARHACCAVRKVAPLARALHGAAGWITGLRADQSATRQDMDFVSFDQARGLLKANPLFDWPRDRIAALVSDEQVPSNPLHQHGFLSIGCAPCTRAVAPGEPERAGRWWWEDEQTKECGLHLSPDGRLVRAGAHA
ncbi:MAG TPA: phosphoadenylyl-sulfate reductase [Acetobacteraceae bacterium]|jgi:phosphoadenosine phosphosulfate reductase|nr:phosphoadenylyl-sulfate reductase [Acetobacteraceae bacterium]